MARCEDFPCCGHEPGCCPDFDPETGQQLNMRCTCGAVLPINNPVSICDTCLRRGSTEDEENFFGVDVEPPFDDECDHDYEGDDYEE